MNKTGIYISGPMTGIKDRNFPAFFAMQSFLEPRGVSVVNPAEMSLEDNFPDWTYSLRRDLIAMLQKCCTVVVLPGWERSRGAVIEVLVAHYLGFSIYYVVDEQLVTVDKLSLRLIKGLLRFLI